MFFHGLFREKVSYHRDYLCRRVVYSAVFHSYQKEPVIARL